MKNTQPDEHCNAECNSDWYGERCGLKTGHPGWHAGPRHSWPNAHLTPAERYRRDPKFTMLVDMLYMQIAQANYTPTELREAIVLAAIKYEDYNISRSRHYYDLQTLPTSGQKRT